MQTELILVRVLEGVVHDDHESEPSLPGSGDDLIGRQEEAEAPGVPQLEGVGVLDALDVGPVDAASAGLVCDSNRRLYCKYRWISRIIYILWSLQKLTDGVDDAAESVLSAIQGSQACDGPLSQSVL